MLHKKVEHYCYICESSKGLVRKCDSKKCRVHFHVRCGMKQGLIKDWETMENYRDPEDPFETLVFCEQHMGDFEDRAKEIPKRELKFKMKAREERMQKKLKKLARLKEENQCQWLTNREKLKRDTLKRLRKKHLISI